MRIESAQFAEHLKAQWPNIDIRSVKNPQRSYSIEWLVQIERRSLEGGLERTGQSVHLDGDVRDSAKFALWFRSQVDRQYKLFFYDEAYSADVELREDTTEEQIVKINLL